MSSLRFKVVEEASNRKAVEVDIPKERPQEYYASKVFNRAKMYEYLPLDTYKALINAIDNKEPISLEVADSVAEGMKR
ncbi:glutamine synthetase III, partial [Duncaniella muris]